MALPSTSAQYLPHARGLHSSTCQLSVGGTSPSDLLEIEGPVTQGSRPGRSAGYLVGGIFALDGSDWSNGLRYYNFDTRPDTEFNVTQFLWDTLGCVSL